MSATTESIIGSRSMIAVGPQPMRKYPPICSAGRALTIASRGTHIRSVRVCAPVLTGTSRRSGWYVLCWWAARWSRESTRSLPAARRRWNRAPASQLRPTMALERHV